MDTSQWPQDNILMRPMEEIVPKPSSVERKIRPLKELANCPRCNSTNTKFCYYNNYSLSQPRYFCKTCRRYWTEGGSLRNIPVGGGSRKNKRQSSSKKIPDLPLLQQNPNKIIYEPQDLNLGFSNFKNINELNIPLPNPSTSSPSHSSHNFSALELLTGSRGLSSFMTMPITNDPNNVYSSSSGFSLPEFRPSLNFSLDGLGSNYENFQGVQETDGKELLFPFEDLNQQVSGNKNDTNDAEQNRDNQQHGADISTGYWNGVIGGGSWN